MKMIYVGSLLKDPDHPDRDSAWIRSFGELECAVAPFSSHIIYIHSWLFSRVWNGICNRFSVVTKKMQNSLLFLVDKEIPKWVHLRLPLAFG